MGSDELQRKLKQNMTLKMSMAVQDQVEEDRTGEVKGMVGKKKWGAVKIDWIRLLLGEALTKLETKDDFARLYTFLSWVKKDPQCGQYIKDIS